MQLTGRYSWISIAGLVVLFLGMVNLHLFFLCSFFLRKEGWEL
jgi:hypothetical protein